MLLWGTADSGKEPKIRDKRRIKIGTSALDRVASHLPNASSLHEN
jgi:hypothetical protein